MAATSRRLSILSTEEIDDLYGLPSFTQDDQRLYFELSSHESEIVAAIRTSSVAANLVLQLGYFKAKRQFFVYELEQVVEDLHYIAALYFPKIDLASIRPLSKPTRLDQQRIILNLSKRHL